MKDVCKSTSTVLKNCLIIVYSYHHYNTLKIADEFSNVLNAQVIAPDQVILEKLEAYDLIGFGAGIDSGRHYKPILDLADMLPEVNKKPAFVFSTSAIQGDAKAPPGSSCIFFDRSRHVETVCLISKKN